MNGSEGIPLDTTEQSYSKLSRLSRQRYITEVEGFQHNPDLESSQVNLWIDGRSVPEYLSSQYPVGGRPMDITLHPIDDETELYNGNMAISIIGEDPKNIVRDLMPEPESYEDWKQAENQAKNFGPEIETAKNIDIFLEAGTPKAGNLAGEDILIHTHLERPEENLYELMSNWNGEVYNPRLNN